MVNTNKKVTLVLATAIFLSPAFAFANMEMNNMQMTNMESSNQNIMNNNSILKLNWKIEWYKVILNWSKYENPDLVWFKVTLLNAKWTEKVISVEKDKNYIENFDASTWVNKYIIYAMSSFWELLKSNEVILNMWPNGWYDFWNKSWTWILKEFKEDKEKYKSDKKDLREQYKSDNYKNKEDYKSQKQEITKKPEMENPMKDLNLSKEQKDSLEKLKVSLENDLKNLRETLNATNIDEIKLKADQLKTDYISKIKSIWESEEFVKLIENRFEIFYKNQFENREAIKKVNENFKEKSKELKQDFKESKENLKEKYKEIITKKYKDKLSTYPEDRLKVVLDKLNARKEKILSDTKITEKKKELSIYQIEWLITVINQIIEEKSSELNLDDIIN